MDLYMIAEAKKLIKEYQKKHKNLETELNRLWWTIANNTKNIESQKACEIEFSIRKLYSTSKEMKRIKQLLKNKAVQEDRIVFRQLNILLNNFKREQYPEDIRQKVVSISSNLEKKFSEFRPSIISEGVKRKVSINEIIGELKISRNSEKRKKIWEAGKKVGRVLSEGKFLKLVNLRNEAATKAGFNDFYEMSLSLSNQSPERIDSLFYDLEKVTEKPFEKLSLKLTNELSKHFGVQEVMPWHYDDLFFQEIPQKVTISLDQYIKKDPCTPVVQLFKGLGFDLEELVFNSDLYERKYKNPHAFCIDIDRKGDIRILANVRKSFNWTSSLLHETAHAAYFKYISNRLPYFLREPAHTFVTEGIAMMMQGFAYHPSWFIKAMEVPKEEILKIEDKLNDTRKMEGIVFARWSLVMYHFEKNLYKNPHQNLQKLWWSLRSKFQLVTIPPQRENEFDWLTKIHLVTNPAYYHNYMIGQLFASQLMDKLKKITGSTSDVGVDFTAGCEKLGESTIDSLKIGNFLKKKVFSQGRKLSWEQLIIHSTGKPLSVEYFVEQYLL
jgi:peptidyl-dipeptidase A